MHVGNFFSHFSIFFFLKVPKVVGLNRHWVLLKYASSVTGIIPDTKMWKKKNLFSLICDQAEFISLILK